MFQGEERIDPDSWTRHTVFGSSERFLKIRRVDAPSDAGSYICKGINGFGTSSFEFVVDVRGGADGDGESGKGQLLALSQNVEEDGVSFGVFHL